MAIMYNTVASTLKQHLYILPMIRLRQHLVLMATARTVSAANSYGRLTLNFFNLAICFNRFYRHVKCTKVVTQ